MTLYFIIEEKTPSLFPHWKRNSKLDMLQIPHDLLLWYEITYMTGPMSLGENEFFKGSLKEHFWRDKAQNK